VRDWLTKAGIAGARFQIVVLADAVPITASKGPDRGQNRRVDFERIK
jgi:outer membrane protein OmpA-like peptidoglycan-associated protein